ncbi:uncharacterized protein TRIADDRAFT_53362 [Trichoplax adhaerens]|uniref:G-protein coupled receptors family 1 profile domain-containing protein n=1 Tax=Trichoplax adhaerens TaxID=10228 RepID=B3RP10_TRIAD|nr:hypothetical protein TRIADDRAFT_53362 [Trichoplax adhaerens]EDV28111.1 hypothetical protein TRIADDRAFT_53362 [Trichoplax adhaerens]|eukprot:XP_002109945.1 hypothetical protein TRIADDRAFT_53362 [Trichoplax adhaerens]
MDNRTNETHHTPLEVIVIKSTIFIIIAIAAVIGNSLVIIVISQYGRNAAQTVTNYLIMNLAILDIINGLFQLPLYLVNIIADRQFYGEIGCAIHVQIGGMGFIGSIHNLMWIAIIRYLVVVKSKKLQSRHAYYCIGIIWATCILVPAVSFLGWGKSVYVDIEKGCVPDWNGNSISGIARGIYDAVIDFAIPLIVITYCYLFIFLFLSRKRRDMICDGFQSPTAMDKANVTSTMFIIFIAFLICIAPWSLLAFIIMPVAQVAVSDGVYFTSLALVLCNSAINPVLYAYRSKDFRIGYKLAIHKIFKCCNN